MKKFMAIVMTVAMVISMMTVVSFAADKMTVSIGNATGAAGETVTLTYNVANNTGVAAMFNELVYDTSALELTAINDKGLFGGATHNAAGNILFWNNATNQTGNGVVAELVFKIKEDAAAGNYTITPKYDIDNYDIIDAGFSPLDVAMVAGSITVEADEPVITEPTATTINVPVAPTAEGGVVTVFQVAGNATEFGVKYDGVEYPSAAKAADLANYYAFAVELIGADGAITAYAK